MEEILTFNDLKKKYNIESVIISENILNKINIIKELIKTDTYVKKVEKSTSENSLYTSSFNCKFKNEDIKKKKITSFLNKLSIDNFEKIYNNIVNDMNELYFSDNIDIILKFMINQKDNFEIYKKILDLYPIDEIKKKIDEIYKKDENYWLISLNYLEKKVYSIECDYNIFCEFIKWRDKSILISKLLLNYKDKSFSECMVKSMLSYIYNNKISKREILDTCIDNMNIFIEYVDKNDIEKMLNIKNIEKSTKFKLIEMYEKKMI
tara:strand:+ start:454 stop:1245 length:792 start_codon:yes stop_codon:yes gene_type:complete